MPTSTSYVRSPHGEIRTIGGWPIGAYCTYHAPVIREPLRFREVGAKTETEFEIVWDGR